MPQDFGTSETWLQNQIDALKSAIASAIDEVPGERHRLILEQMLHLNELTNELHRLQLVTILTHIQQNNRDVDDDLREISDYMEQILVIHRNEAENLGKIL